MLKAWGENAERLKRQLLHAELLQCMHNVQTGLWRWIFKVKVHDQIVAWLDM